MGNFTGREEMGNSSGLAPNSTRTEPRGASLEFIGGQGMDLEMPSSSSSSLSSAIVELEELVPTVFKWEHGGRQVFITGTFNNWESQIPMHRSGNDFTYIHNLKKGKHAFKFIVDDEWRFAPDLPTVADVEVIPNLA
jgi:5'-AMP-activated protein kinase regulatory beta subunit